MPALASPATRGAPPPRTHDGAPPSPASFHDATWTDAERAVWLLAVDPAGLGGVCIQGPDSPVRQRLQDTARKAWPDGAPWLRLPVQIDNERLLGGLDLGLSLAAGHPVRQPGLLADSAGGVLLIGSAERVSPALAGKLAAALDRGPGSARKDGADTAYAGTKEAPCTVIALDSCSEPDERPAAALLERLALRVDIGTARPTSRDAAVPAVWPPASTEGHAFPGDLARARERLATIPVDVGCIEAFCRAAEMLGVPSMRAPLQAWRTARAAAALADHASVTQEDAELAARLVIAPRARQRPAEAAPPDTEDLAPSPTAPAPDSTRDSAEQAAGPDATSPPQEQVGEHRSPDDPTRSPDSQPKPPAPADVLPEQVLAAAQAAIPQGLLLSLAQGLVTPRSRSSGRSGATAAGSDRGRPLPSRRGELRGKARLDLLATLRAAVPWQTLRRPGAAPASAPTRLIVRREDFHIRRCRQPQARTVIFVVDASGSQALHRLAEAKGAVELLLADCYVQRDRVALVAFRAAQADVLLPPTRSLVRARRSLTALPGGGGTPLAAGLAAADRLAEQVQREAGQSALVVLLTDARANVALDGLGGREQAMDDALRCARRLREHATPALMIDTGTRPDARGRALAQAMAARHVVLPQANAASLHRVVHVAMRDSPASPR